MKSDDGIINIGCEYNRIKYYKGSSPDLYEYLSEGNTVDIRFVKIKINTNETEYLLTNLTKEEFSTAEMSNLYNLRWKIELNYKHLKNNIKIKYISSSKRILIKQDIYSQVLVANILQVYINGGDEELSHLKYKNEVKVNNNMAIGIFKNTLIYILLEENPDKMNEMMDKFQQKINRFMVPVKPNRQIKEMKILKIDIMLIKERHFNIEF